MSQNWIHHSFPMFILKSLKRRRNIIFMACIVCLFVCACVLDEQVNNRYNADVFLVGVLLQSPLTTISYATTQYTTPLPLPHIKSYHNCNWKFRLRIELQKKKKKVQVLFISIIITKKKKNDTIFRYIFWFETFPQERGEVFLLMCVLSSSKDIMG